jgi:hypothetical protein
MAILGTDPPDYEHSNVVLIESSAPTNREALLEIEDWAAQHGFVRTTESFLRQVIRRDGIRAYRSTCYRLDDQERAAIADRQQEILDRSSRMTTEVLQF